MVSVLEKMSLKNHSVNPTFSLKNASFYPKLSLYCLLKGALWGGERASFGRSNGTFGSLEVYFGINKEYFVTCQNLFRHFVRVQFQ